MTLFRNLKIKNILIFHLKSYLRIKILSDICNELDCTLTNIPGLKATTQEEKDNVKKLYQCVFDAQKALDMVLKDPNTNVVDVTSE